MTFLTETVAPGITIYKDSINFSDKLISLSENDSRSWVIRNQEATTWSLGDKILGYDEYSINFNFLVDEHFLLLGKKIFDCASDYAKQNLTTINGIDSCILRRYSSGPAFLELESPDVDNVARKITTVTFLNTMENSGGVTFKNFSSSTYPTIGKTIVFPSSFAYSFKINRPKDFNNYLVISHFV